MVHIKIFLAGLLVFSIYGIFIASGFCSIVVLFSIGSDFNLNSFVYFGTIPTIVASVVMLCVWIYRIGEGLFDE